MTHDVLRGKCAIHPGLADVRPTRRNTNAMNAHMIMNRLCKLSLMLPVLLLGVGCVGATDEHGDDDEQVGAAQEAFSTYGSWSWGTAGHSTAAAPIGSDPQTCFLSGVAGNLRSYYGAPGGYTAAYAEVYRSGSNWYINTYGPDTNSKVGATAICLPTSTNRTATVGWSTGYPAQVLAPVTANRRCGLMGVGNTEVYYNDNQWQSATDSVYIWNDGTNWYIGGTGHAQGYGGCVDVSSTSGTWNWTWAPTGGTSTLNLLQKVDGGTNPLGTQCFLTGVGGAFQSDDWNNGVFINYDAGSQWWSMTVSNNKTGKVTCVQ
jgi:hypothetical protein